MSVRAFFCPFGAIFEVEVRFKKYFLGHTNVDYKFWFWKYSPIFAFLILALFDPWVAIFGLGVMFKILFRTFLCRQSTLVSELQSYFCFLIRPHLEFFFLLFQSFGAFYGLSELFFGLGSIPKTFSGTANVDYQSRFQKNIHVFLSYETSFYN